MQLCFFTDDRHGVLWVSLLASFMRCTSVTPSPLRLATLGRTSHYNPEIKDRFAPLEEATGIKTEFYPALGGYRER